MKTSELIIDSSVGGNGDVWMRLVSFYAASAILPELKITIIVPPFLQKLSNFTFGDRLNVVTNRIDVDYSYTSMGIKDLLKGICSGKKYIAPYHRSVIHDKKRKEHKDYLNILLFNIANSLGVIKVPAWKWIEVYQGYLDIIGLKQLKSISYEAFSQQLALDYPSLFDRLNDEHLPISPELVIPDYLNQAVVVFPTGTSRQFVPIWWAKKYLPEAYYAFFFKDKDAEKFISQGLKVVFFYKEPGDIIALSHAAKWTITTDSFPSHLLQYSNVRCSVTITEVLKSRIISPTFKGKVIDSQVDCHPCLHLERKSKPTCMAGFKECLNWNNWDYSKEIIESI